MEQKLLKSFKDLTVWQKAVDLISLTYSNTRKFPDSELYGLTNLNSNKGFTLIELIITTTIVIALTIGASISILSYKNNQDISLEANEIVAALRGAQNNSLSREGGTQWGVYFENTTSSAFYVIFSGSAYSATTTYTKKVLPSNVQFNKPAIASSSSVVFSPITGMPNAALLIQISLINNPDVARTITVDANGVINEYLSASYIITVFAGSGGSISPPGPITVIGGDNSFFSITADPGYAISDVLVDDVSQGAVSSYNFINVQTDHTISASFIVVYTITASAGSGGSILPSGDVSVNEGDNRSFTINSDNGYIIFDVLVDDVSQGAIDSYNFINVQTDHTISAIFSATGIDSTYRYAWNDNIGWIDFGYPAGNVNVMAAQLTGYAYDSNILEIALDCATSPAGNICSSSDFKVNKNPSTGDLSGWAWNDDIGWISFNCSDPDLCATSNYKVNVNTSTGAFTGWAWNDNIGWISFNCSDPGLCGSSDYRVNIAM